LQSAPLDHGIGEVGRADHDARDLGRLRIRDAEDVIESGRDSAGHVFCGRGFDLGNDLIAAHKNGVGVGATDVDTDS
jgi:hypothetical protein